MDSDRLKKDLSIVESDDLPLLYEDGNLNKDGFICEGCEAKVTPVSYKENNLRRPYFRIDNEHMSDCYIFNYKKLIKIGKKRKVSTSSGFPLPYPSKLYLQDKNIQTINQEEVENNIPINTTTNYVPNANKTEVDIKHHRISSTIRPIVKYFIDFPYDRDILLSIPMLDTYNKVFKKINTYNYDNIEKFRCNYSNLKLYYAILSAEKNNIQQTETNISLKLLSKKNHNIYLTIGTTKWNIRKKSEILKELNQINSFM